MSIRVFAISDSPRISTGFGNVAKQIYQGFHDAGWEVHALGMLDTEMDNKKELPYAFYPVLIDMMGFGDLQLLLPRIRPDIVWIMIDPGNLLRHIVELLKIKEESKLDFKIVAYPPVEGRPLSHFQIEALKEVMKHGRLVFWTQSAVDIAREAGIDNPDYVHFGVDHAPFRKYPDDVKAKLKANVGLKDKFVVGSIGVNKRTKGFPTIIYTAKVLKQQGVDDVLFYCHTEPDSPTMQGHYLRHMAKTYGVNDRVLFKTDVDANTRRQWVGVERDRNNLDDLLNKRMPRSPVGRMKLWMQYDFITRMNCFDVYLDVSQVEGWGMPQCFSGDTPIWTKTGQTPIKDIKTGDVVMTHTGQYKRVTNVMKRTGWANQIKTRYGHSVIVSDEHPFLAIKREGNRFSELKKGSKPLEWIKMGDLTVGDILVTPKPKTIVSENSTIDLASYSLNLLEQDGYIASKYSNNKQWLNKTVNLDREVALLLGWYVAEGSYSHKKVEFSMNVSEYEDAVMLSDILTRKFNATSSIRVKGNKLRLCCSSVILGNMLAKECGSGSRNKQVPHIVRNSNNQEIQKAFLQGYTRGDGHVGNGGVSISTNSHNLAVQIKELLVGLGILSTIYVGREYSVGVGGKAATKWANISDEPLERPERIGQGYYEDDSYFYYPITSIEQDVFYGDLFNIEVEEDHSYVANFIATHNCEAMACGVPVLYPDDKSCRTELLKPGVILPTLPERLWDTWHTGARLVTFDPEEVAGSILTLRNNKALMQAMSTEGLNWTCHFKWDKTREEMNKRVKEVYETGS